MLKLYLFLLISLAVVYCTANNNTTRVELDERHLRNKRHLRN